MIRARIAEDPTDRRRSSRVPVDLDATMRELGATGVGPRRPNNCASGFMAAPPTEKEGAARGCPNLPGRERANAVVKWTAGDRMGAEFAEPISLEGLPASVSSD